ncbi:hypothetical protein PFMALIP_04265 [Plasmodium falciparum MaliPS096_E11]|uniref:Uncharacterized protein n=1 Tax=Plasmodium falciparum MaliPS096_E11 TaxID=1036727 RepID=A0A024WKP1_PLAFA|nr:hypothetical protein PFMALIP_04265 [Plasmodium falciparum MaliPS096_E11]
MNFLIDNYSFILLIYIFNLPQDKKNLPYRQKYVYIHIIITINIMILCKKKKKKKYVSYMKFIQLTL